MAGLGLNGFTPKTFTEILDAIKDSLRASFGSGVDTNEDEAVIQIIKPLALEASENWDGTEKVYDNFNPNTAEGVALDNIGAITNTPRIAGANSTVIASAEGTEGAEIPIYFKRSVQDTGATFQTSQTYVLPPVNEQPLEFQMVALQDGPIQAIAGTLNQGSLPSGVTSVINLVDAEVGSYDETDEEYRVSRKERLSQIAGATVVSIKSALLAVQNVTAVRVFENDTSEPKDGLPSHCIKAVVSGTYNHQDIIDTIGIKKGAGTYTEGDIIGTYVDPTDGQKFTIRYSTVSQLPIYVAVVVTERNDQYPVDGDQLIKDAILALSWAVGEDVTLPKLQSAVVSIPGIVTYTLFFGLSSNPTTNDTIVIGEDSQADFDSRRVSVIS